MKKSLKELNSTRIFVVIPLSIATLILFLYPTNTEEYPNTVQFPDSNNIVINVELAKTTEERTQGLMYRQTLPNDTGMLFIFDNEKLLTFWMKDTHIPLDIIFISENGIINSIHPDTTPNNIGNKYTSLTPSKYALETNAGYAAQNNINIGDKTIFSTIH